MDEQQTVVELPCFGIKITLEGSKEPYGWDSGAIESDLKGICPYCRNLQCDMSCPQFLESLSDRDEEMQRAQQQEAIDFQRYRIVMDSIESIVLAHAIAGINVEGPDYVEGIETACNAIINDI